jgi:hypothetical protein
MQRPSRRAVLLGVVAAVLSAPAVAASLVHLNLEQLSSRAERIFRGTVIAVESESVKAGGSELPVVVYRLKVDDMFKGEFDTSRDDVVVQVRMLGASKRAQPGANGQQRLSALPELPTLRMGEQYLLFVTKESAIGLSAPVGLGQGTFKIVDDGKQVVAVNEFDNQGLGRGVEALGLPRQGPVEYGRLARAIRAVLKGGQP